MRVPSRKRPEDSPLKHSEVELRRFVGMMVHDLGYRVPEIRSLAHSLQEEPGLRSERGRSDLDALAHAADDLAFRSAPDGAGDAPDQLQFGALVRLGDLVTGEG